MRSRLTPLLGAALLTASLSAQSSQPPVFHNIRSWSPTAYDVEKLVPCDLDGDERDDVLMLLANGSVVRAANPGMASGFFAVPELSGGTVDLAAIRIDDGPDLVVTVSGTQGLVIHGMRPEGNFLSLPSSPALWTGISELRAFESNGPVLAGREASTDKIYTARLDLATFSFQTLSVAQFPNPLFDFALSKRSSDPEVHVLGVSATGLERRHVDGALISSTPASSVAGHVVQLPGSTFAAWARQPNPNALWELVLERNGLVGPTVALDFPGTALSSLDLADLDAADFNGDGFADLALGQSSGGDFGVLYGSLQGYEAQNLAVITSKKPKGGGPMQIGAVSVPTVIGRPDGSRAGLFHVADAADALEVVHGAPLPQSMANPSDGLDSWLPNLGHDVPNVNDRNLLYGQNDLLTAKFFFPADFLAATRSLGHTHMQIELWRVDDLVDLNTAEITLGQSSVHPVMQSNLAWSLRQENGQVADTHEVDLTILFGTAADSFDWQGKHALLLVRVGNLVQQSGTDPILTGSLFTTPIWLAMNEFEQPIFTSVSPFLTGGILAPFFDPGIGDVPVEDRSQTTGTKDIARIRPGAPVFPGMPNVPIPTPIAPQTETR